MSACLAVDDIVRVRGVSEDSPEYDEGRVVLVVGDAADVYWYVAKVVYRDDVRMLERIGRTNHRGSAVGATLAMRRAVRP